MAQERFIERVKQKLGEVNPAYVEELLKKDVLGLLAWIDNNLQDMRPTVLETIGHARRHRDSGNNSSQDVLLFGIELLRGRLELALFVLNEVGSMINAIDVSPKIKDVSPKINAIDISPEK